MKNRIKKLQKQIKPAPQREYEYDLSGFTEEELHYLIDVCEDRAELTPEMDAKLQASIKPKGWRFHETR